MLSKVAEARLLEHTIKSLKEHSLEINKPRIVTCQIKELLKVENYTIPKHLKIRKQLTTVRILPMSTHLISRNLVTANGKILGGFLSGQSKFTRLHVVLMTNLKLKAIASSGGTIYGDYVKDG